MPEIRKVIFCLCHCHCQRVSKKLTRTLGVECIVTGNYDLYVLVILIVTVIVIVIVIGLKRYSSALGIKGLQLMSDGAENNEGHILSSTNKDGQTLLCCVFTNAMVHWHISSKKKH